MRLFSRFTFVALLAGLLAPSAALSANGDFLDSVEFSGWVSASYNYNFDSFPDGELAGANTGGDVLSHPFKPDTNSFSFDQLWFEMERPVSAQQPAGFRADITYGKSAGLLSGSTPDGSSGNDFEVYQAYVQYLAGATTWKAGKFATLIGAEVVQAPSNFNITRGQVYNLFQPITHTGVLMSASVGAADVNVGIVNGTRNFPASDTDINTNKALLASVGFAPADALSVSLAGAYGEVDGGGKESILDLIVSFDPTDNLSIYLNADYIKTEDVLSCTPDSLWEVGTGDRSTDIFVAYDGDFLDLDGIAATVAAGDAVDGTNTMAVDDARGGGATHYRVEGVCDPLHDVDGFGVALAGRLALSDATGVSLRAEYVDLDNYFGAGSPLETVTLTGTVDHALADGIVLRGELRYDSVEEGACGDPATTACFGPSGEPADDQVVAGVELIYSF